MLALIDRHCEANADSSIDYLLFLSIVVAVFHLRSERKIS
jgi:hypothetical protein